MGQCSSGFEWRCRSEPKELAPQVCELKVQLARILQHLDETDRQLSDLMEELTHAARKTPPPNC